MANAVRRLEFFVRPTTNAWSKEHHSPDKERAFFGLRHVGLRERYATKLQQKVTKFLTVTDRTDKIPSFIRSVYKVYKVLSGNRQCDTKRPHRAYENRQA